MSGQASAAVIAAAMAALREVGGLTGSHEAMPLQAAPPYATVAAGLEADWSHKSGLGREARLTVTLIDQGERPTRLRRLAAEVAEALEGIGPELDGWQLVTLVFVRSMIIAQSAGRWALTLDYRARMLAV
jgi:hypothetical protein